MATDPLPPEHTPPGTCGAVLLAAGFSRRFGAIKQQALLPDGTTLLQQSFKNILQATENIIVVGRRELLANGTYSFLPTIPTVQLVLCEDAASGMGHSLASAISHIPSGWQSALICLADMPLISSDTLRAIMSASAPDSIVIPVWQMQRGHPVSFGRHYFDALAQSRGDSGGRALITQNSHHVIELITDDEGIVLDIDTPETLKHLVSSGQIPVM